MLGKYSVLSCSKESWFDFKVKQLSDMQAGIDALVPLEKCLRVVGVIFLVALVHVDGGEGEVVPEDGLGPHFGDHFPVLLMEFAFLVLIPHSL